VAHVLETFLTALSFSQIDSSTLGCFSILLSDATNGIESEVRKDSFEEVSFESMNGYQGTVAVRNKDDTDHEKSELDEEEDSVCFHQIRTADKTLLCVCVCVCVLTVR
jgi:hypothetical protein